jgi:hypothetical protein
MEHRLVLYDLLGTLNEHPRVDVEFSSLEGVVFGIGTPERDKLEIMRQALAHSERTGRKDFRFYQMAFHARKGTLLRL